MSGPLAGVKVIEVGQALAGPLAGVIMADMGAEVIKVEKPDGGDDARLWGPPFVGPDSVSFHTNNRGKKSITLDIKSAADVAALKELVKDADILIQNLRPGIVDDFGIGPDALMAVNPRLIYCSIWAFGYTGPLKLAPGFDPLLQCYGAVVTLTGRPDDPPTFCAPAINDTATGMWCVIGALAALKQRDTTGKGCVVDASLFESAVAWVQGPLNNYHVTGKMQQRHGAASATLSPYQIFETADRPICIAAGNDRLFVKLARAGPPGVVRRPAPVGRPQARRQPRSRRGVDAACPVHEDAAGMDGDHRGSGRALRPGQQPGRTVGNRAVAVDGHAADPARDRPEDRRAADQL